MTAKQFNARHGLSVGSPPVSIITETGSLAPTANLGLLPVTGGTMTGPIVFVGGQTFPGTGDVTLAGTQTLTNKTLTSPALTTPVSTGTRETRVAITAADIDLAAGNYFTRTNSGAVSLTVSNVPSAGITASFILDLTNGGSGAVTWWSGVKWASGTAPTLTASGRDVLGFFTHDGGTTWIGLVLAKDVK